MPGTDSTQPVVSLKVTTIGLVGHSRACVHDRSFERGLYASAVVNLGPHNPPVFMISLFVHAESYLL